MTEPYLSTEITRRQMLRRAGAGFGAIGLAGALSEGGLLSTASAAKPDQLLPHFAPKARRVLFLFMNGAPSHVDTFDPKPALKEHEGENPTERSKGKGAGYMPSPFKFQPHGESGPARSRNHEPTRRAHP